MVSEERKVELKRLLDKQPRYPISLLPTPLTELPRFSKALGGPRVWMKRDDLTGIAYGGNKGRKLDYFIGEAVTQGCDIFIGGGGAVQSNHALMCAAAARKAGMKPVIFARAGTHHYELQGDYLLTKIVVDGGLYLYSRGEPGEEQRQPQLADVMNRVADELDDQGYRPYVLPGSGQPAGTLGYVECALELTSQCEAQGITPDWVFLTSSGGGQAGLLVGAKFLGQSHRIVGCAPAPSRNDKARSVYVADLANRTAALLGADVHIDSEEVTNLNYGGEAYGVPSKEGLKAMRLLAQTEGIFLDPVYTSKGVSGLIDQIRKGVVSTRDTVVYVHTGGGPLNFAYNRELIEAYKLSLETDHHISA